MADMTLGLALAIVLAIVVIVVTGRRCRGARERFVPDPAPAVFRAAREIFANNPAATYSDYKVTVPGADPVQFTDMRNLWLSGRMSVDTVRQAL
jgi:hypothetical protein